MPHTNELVLLPNHGWDERILICRNGELVQTFIVVTQRYVVLVDTGINPATAQQMVDYARPALDARRVLLVINTHADYDHAWGNQLFADPDAPFPAPILGSRRCADRLRMREEGPLLEELQRTEPTIFGHVRLTPPTLWFDDEVCIDGGDLTLHLIPTPGHTDDHLSIYIPEIATLLAGDAAELPYPAARTTAGLPAMRASLATLAALNARTVLYCHAPVDAGPQLLHDNLAYFNALERACRAFLEKSPGAELPTDDAALIRLIGCDYADVTPHSSLWREVNAHYRTTGHAEQLRMMITWLQAQD
ncbi:MAG TPA: MBL fold metallo-hydrolase [Chloroflexi bacterium]|nr:MBL fold metallo-hydrolase [Chloroflexota bacterium]